MSVSKAVRTHLRRSPYQTAAAILTMFLTFLVGGVFFLATMTSVVILQYFESKPQITVFFDSKSGAKEADLLKTKLEATGLVASTNFVSKEQALEIYRNQNKSDPLLLEMVTSDILPASLEVSATDPKSLGDLVSVIKGAVGVEEIVYQRDVVDTLLAWTNAIRIAGSVIALLLIVDSMLIIGTVIAMKVALKRDEIEILRLVGATLWSIRAPFIIEGGLYGLIGSFFASGIILGVVLWLRPFLYTFLGSIPLLAALLANPQGQMFLVYAAIFVVGNLLVGFILGAVGSFIALIRYLHI